MLIILNHIFIIKLFHDNQLYYMNYSKYQFTNGFILVTKYKGNSGYTYIIPRAQDDCDLMRCISYSHRVQISSNWICTVYEIKHSP